MMRGSSKIGSEGARVVVMSKEPLNERHWLVTAYLARALAGGMLSDFRR